MNGNALIYLGTCNWLFEELLVHSHYTASFSCSLEHKKSFLESLKWYPEKSSHCGVFLCGLFSLLGVYSYHYSLFESESTFSFPKIGKYFEFSCEL